jgi:hypothetical protein
MSKWVPIVTVAALFGLTGLQDPIARDPFGAATIAVDNGQLASVLVNLHTSAGTGNGMGNIMTAFLNKTPLIITAGQQTREMILCDPMLTNRDETMLPRPYVKWAYQPIRRFYHPWREPMQTLVVSMTLAIHRRSRHGCGNNERKDVRGRDTSHRRRNRPDILQA